MASKIKVDQIQTADGTGTIALQNQLSGMTTASLPALGSAQMPTGSVLQVVQSGSISRTTFTSTNTWVDTDNELSITPSSTNSKILITAYQGSRLDGDTPIRGSFRLLRGSTAVWNTSGLSEQFQVRNAANEFNQSSTISYLDSPSTTSSVTYKIQGWLTTGTNFIAWESHYGANMILMEIAG